MSQIYRYKCAVHIHSTHSDGTGNLKTIIKAAKKAGLDFIIVTDHNYIDFEEGIFDGVYVIKGEEISPADCNHYLALGIDSTIEPNNNPQIYVDKVREQGGFGFAAHPDEGVCDNGEQRKNSNHCIPWTDKNIIPDGVEIWNWFSRWADALDDTNIFTLAYSFLFKHKIILPPSRITLDWWDKLNNQAENIVPALGGVDAHALKIKKYIIPVTVFPYETCLNTITNIISMKEELSKDFQKAKKQILNALKNGNNVIINRNITKDIPKVYIEDSNSVYVSGETIELSKDLCIRFVSNNPMEIRLFYNGNTEGIYSSNNLIFPITKSGKYRIEASYRGKSFLYTNPFCIKDKIEEL